MFIYCNTLLSNLSSVARCCVAIECLHTAPAQSSFTFSVILSKKIQITKLSKNVLKVFGVRGILWPMIKTNHISVTCNSINVLAQKNLHVFCRMFIPCEWKHFKKKKRLSCLVWLNGKNKSIKDSHCRWSVTNNWSTNHHFTGSSLCWKSNQNTHLNHQGCFHFRELWLHFPLSMCRK